MMSKWSLISFLFLKASVQYDEMEGFLHSCKQLNMKLFKDVALEEYLAPPPEQDAYELNHFQLMCRNCYKVYPDEKSLKRHTWGCMKPKTLQCRYCEKTFRFKNDIINHERYHTGEKPFRDGIYPGFTIRLKAK
jgi:hypothetical protein